jgi:hypothetical protein
MARIVINKLKEKKIKYLVSPYEADAQMSYLYKKGIIHGVITVDSDLICYEVGHLFYKLSFTGEGKYLNTEKLFSSKIISKYPLNNFDKNSFLIMCIMSGCDYLKSFKGVGLKKAYKIVKEDSLLDNCIKKALSGSTSKYSVETIEKYKENFIKAILTFRFQVVYCPMKEELVYLSEKDDSYYNELNKQQDLSFLGSFEQLNSDKEALMNVVKGDYCPFTRKPFKSLLGYGNVKEMLNVNKKNLSQEKLSSKNKINYISRNKTGQTNEIVKNTKSNFFLDRKKNNSVNFTSNSCINKVDLQLNSNIHKTLLKEEVSPKKNDTSKIDSSGIINTGKKSPLSFNLTSEDYETNIKKAVEKDDDRKTFSNLVVKPLFKNIPSQNDYSPNQDSTLTTDIKLIDSESTEKLSDNSTDLSITNNTHKNMIISTLNFSEDSVLVNSNKTADEKLNNFSKKLLSIYFNNENDQNLINSNSYKSLAVNNKYKNPRRTNNRHIIEDEDKENIILSIKKNKSELLEADNKFELKKQIYSLNDIKCDKSKISLRLSDFVKKDKEKKSGTIQIEDSKNSTQNTINLDSFKLNDFFNIKPISRISKI